MAEVTMAQILHVIPRDGFGGKWQALCMISDGPQTWLHLALGDTPEDALGGCRDWLGTARICLEAGKPCP